LQQYHRGWLLDCFGVPATVYENAQSRQGDFTEITSPSQWKGLGVSEGNDNGPTQDVQDVYKKPYIFQLISPTILSFLCEKNNDRYRILRQALAIDGELDTSTAFYVGNGLIF
jgi:hypothetical protein